MEKYIPRFFNPPEQSYFLFGPRGTGKTTFLKHSYPEAHWVDFLRPDTLRMYLARPERIVELVRGNPETKIFIIDEVQKVPEILSAIHGLIESFPEKRFILTGSSSRKIKRTGADLLAGRLLLKTMHPFMLSEFDGAFEDALAKGLLPIVAASDHPQEVLDAYVSLYVREEVQMEGLVRNLGGFSRFLEAISFSHAGLLNISNIARECEVERKTVESYIQILEDILLAFRLPVFKRRAKRTAVSHPKFYFFDSGVFKSLRPRGPLDRPDEAGGAALEGLLAQHLRAWNAYRGNPFDLYFWRTRSGVEVDFILYGEEGLFAIEVKNTNRIRPSDLKSLKAFREDYPGAHLLFLYRGEERMEKDGILCLPCESFLKNLHPNQRLLP